MSRASRVPQHQAGEGTIYCDEEGAVAPACWQGSIENIGSDYSAILGHHKNGLLRVVEHRGTIVIRGRDRVGVIRLPSGRRLVVRTKVPGLALVDWLVYLGEFPALQHWDGEGNISQSDSWHRVLAKLYIQELEAVTRSHLRKGFAQFATESPEVRGRILTHRLSRRPWQLPVIPQVVRGRTFNTPPNQMLAAALDHLLLLLGELSAEQQAAFQRLRHAWSGIVRSSQDCEFIVQSSLAAPPSGYQAALQLARLILSGASLDSGAGWGGDSFTISLARIWENAINKMCLQLAASTGWKVAPREKSTRRWDDDAKDDDPRRSMIADTVLERQDQRWILDAKYKNSFGNENRTDRFQMCAYALGFDASRATLVYPNGIGETDHRQLLRTQYGCRAVLIDAAKLPMADGPAACLAKLAQLLKDDCSISAP